MPLEVYEVSCVYTAAQFLLANSLGKIAGICRKKKMQNSEMGHSCSKQFGSICGLHATCTARDLRENLLTFGPW